MGGVGGGGGVEDGSVINTYQYSTVCVYQSVRGGEEVEGYGT